MKSFSQRLTRRIVIALTLVLSIIAAGTTYFAARFTGPLVEAYYEHLADIENESIEKKLIGVDAGDLSPDLLHDYLLSKDLQANTEGLIKVPRKLEGNPRQWVRSVIVDKNGYYVSHPEKERMQRDNFFKSIHQKTDTVAARVVSEMETRKKGSAELTVDGVPSTVFYSPLEKSGWSLVVILPKIRYYIVVFGFCILLSLFLLSGLLAVYFICRTTIRRSTRPLQVLASSADEVAKGNFNAPLPDIRHQDEIGLLRDSFGNMQQSLSQYIEELKTTTAQKSAIESELSIARRIQMSMLTTDIPECPDLAIHAMLNPAKAVGGDLYDFFLRDNSLYFCIGDVAGKGVPAALVMTTACGAFRLLLESESEPMRIVGRMNNMMIRDNSMTIFVTFFAGVLDLNTGHLRYCNAGHKAPLVDGQPLPVHHNLPLGVIPDWEFEAQEADLAPGSTLFLYTDGLDEAEDAKHRQFGKKRIVEVMQTSSLQPHVLIERMTQAVADFVGDTEQSDDLTMLAIQCRRIRMEGPSLKG